LRQSDGDKEEQELSAVPDPAAPVPSAYRAEVADGVLRLTFTRPEAGNAIPTEAVPGLKSLVQGINADPLVRAVLVRGEGANFSAGGDLKGFERGLSLSPEERRADFERRLAILGDLVAAFLTLEVPVVAACRGGIAGAGLMYALGADVVMVDDTAKFIFAQQRIGLTPDGGISHLLPRIVGLRRASQLILTGAVVGAAEALALGLVSRIVASADLDAQAEQQAAAGEIEPFGHLHLGSRRGQGRQRRRSRFCGRCTRSPWEAAARLSVSSRLNTAALGRLHGSFEYSTSANYNRQVRFRGDQVYRGAGSDPRRCQARLRRLQG